MFSVKFSEQDMDTQKAIITGAEGGLGKALSASLRTASVEVLTPGRNDLDVADSDQVKLFFADAGDVDLLICNAGVTADKPLVRMTESDWDSVMAVNLKGAFLCAREAAKIMMKRRNGHIIFISSYSAVHPPVGQANYAAAKLALLGMMQSMAKELGSRNVRVNAILPGFLETKMTEGLSDTVKVASKEKHTLGRFNTPEAVGDFVAYLHQKLPHTSGQVFNLDSRVL